MKNSSHSLILGVLLLSLPSLSLRATPPEWSVTSGHQYAMVVYATVMDPAGNEMNTPGSLLSVREYGVLMGATPISKGPKGTLYQLKVTSDNWESELTYSFYDANTDKVVEIGPGPGFESGSTVGSIVEPVILQIPNQVTSASGTK